VVLLAGEAGVGKTRLLLEFADQAQRRGSRILAGGCVELGDIALPTCPSWMRYADLPTIRPTPSCWPRSP
jgi:hypothetical protein